MDLHLNLLYLMSFTLGENECLHKTSTAKLFLKVAKPKIVLNFEKNVCGVASQLVTRAM